MNTIITRNPAGGFYSAFGTTYPDLVDVAWDSAVIIIREVTRGTGQLGCSARAVRELLDTQYGFVFGTAVINAMERDSLPPTDAIRQVAADRGKYGLRRMARSAMHKSLPNANKTRPAIRNEYERDVQNSDMLKLLGIEGTHLPVDGMPPRIIQGVKVWVTPKPALKPGLRHSATHRVMCECSLCGKHMSRGRLFSHYC